MNEQSYSSVRDVQTFEPFVNTEVPFDFGFKFEDDSLIENSSMTLSRESCEWLYELYKSLVMDKCNCSEEIWNDYFQWGKVRNALRGVDTMKPFLIKEAIDFAEKVITTIPSFHANTVASDFTNDKARELQDCFTEYYSSIYYEKIQQVGETLRGNVVSATELASQFPIGSDIAPDGILPHELLDIQLFDSIIDPLLSK